MKWNARIIAALLSILMLAAIMTACNDNSGNQDNNGDGGYVDDEGYYGDDEFYDEDGDGVDDNTGEEIPDDYDPDANGGDEGDDPADNNGDDNNTNSTKKTTTKKGDTTKKTTTKKTTPKTTNDQGGWVLEENNTGIRYFKDRPVKKGSTVHVFIPWDISADTNQKTVIKDFEKKYGVTVKLTVGTWGEREIKLQQMIRGKQSPDYLPTIVGDFPRRAIKGVMMDIKDYIVVNDRVDTYTMDNITAKDGAKYAIIGKRAPGILYFNTTMLKNAAIAKTPLQLYKTGDWTWATMKEMARKLTVDKTNDGKPEIYGFGTELDFMFGLSAGTDVIKITNGNAKLNIDDANWRNAMTWFYDGINKDKIFSPVRWGMRDEFMNGKVAMYYGLAGDATYINQTMKTWDIAPFPVQKKGDTYIGSSGNDGFGVATGAANPVGGIAFGEFSYNWHEKLTESGQAKSVFTKAQEELMNSLEHRVTWLQGYGMEDSFCQDFGNFMRANGDFTALMEEMRPIWEKCISDTIKGR